MRECPNLHHKQYKKRRVFFVMCLCLLIAIEVLVIFTFGFGLTKTSRKSEQPQVVESSDSGVFYSKNGDPIYERTNSPEWLANVEELETLFDISEADANDMMSQLEDIYQTEYDVTFWGFSSFTVLEETENHYVVHDRYDKVRFEVEVSVSKNQITYVKDIEWSE